MKGKYWWPSQVGWQALSPGSPCSSLHGCAAGATQDLFGLQAWSMTTLRSHACSTLPSQPSTSGTYSAPAPEN